jgi:glycosyltransferase involved in cell wall biosynthesis
MQTPPLSVVMPVFNALPYLDEAVECILRQSFADFEFVILDDGSTDGSRARLREWAARDPRIRLVGSDERLGPVGSSNRVAAEAKAPLVARMDADDLCTSDRLERQMNILAAHPDAVLVGSIYETVDRHGRVVREADYARLTRPSLFAPFSHPTIMYRRDAFERAGGYRAGAERWEDVDLYLRLAREGRMLVVAAPLVSIRLSGASSRIADRPDEVEASMDRLYRRLAEEAGTPRRDVQGKLVPESFLVGGSIRIWAGERPRSFARLLRRGALGFDLASLRMLVWSGWAEASPRSLRLFLRALLALRNRAALRRLGGARYVEWRPPLAGRSA